MQYTASVQTADVLNETFALPGMLTFDEPYPGMPRARITTPACTAEFYLQGAHLTRWQPTGTEPVLFLSERSAYVPGKAIRGGVPLVFPWLGAPENSPVKPPAGTPAHGFARIWPGTMHFAALAGEEVHLSVGIDHTPGLRALGYATFQLACEFVLGRELTVRLSVANTGDQPLVVEEALHAYLAVGNSEQVSVEGLSGTEYLDKTEGFQRERQTEPALAFHGEVDRPYLNTTAALTLVDPVLRRCLRLCKAGSRTTVTWNPGAAAAAKLADLGPDEWQRFVCLETANAADNVLTLAPQEAHTMEMRLRVEPYAVS